MIIIIVIVYTCILWRTVVAGGYWWRWREQWCLRMRFVYLFNHKNVNAKHTHTRTQIWPTNNHKTTLCTNAAHAQQLNGYYTSYKYSTKYNKVVKSSDVCSLHATIHVSAKEKKIRTHDQRIWMIDGVKTTLHLQCIILYFTLFFVLAQQLINISSCFSLLFFLVNFFPRFSNMF